MSTEVVRRSHPDRFELLLDGQVIGLAEFTDADGKRDFTHTEINPAHDGKGYGSQLVSAALTETHAEGLGAVGTCWFVEEYLVRHPEFRTAGEGTSSQA